MKSVETSAKTRKEAIQQALDKLRCELHEVNIEILDEGSRGILGFGARPVRVRVSAEHLVDAPPPREKRRPDEGGGRRERPRKGRGERREGERKGRGGERDRRPKQDQSGERKPPRSRREEGNGKRERDKGERPRGEGRVNEDRPERERRPAIQRSESTPAEAPRRRPEREVIDPEAAAAMGKTAAALLSEIIDKMGMAAAITSRVDDEGNIVLDVKTEDTAILIGRKGRNLQSLQFLINRIMLQQEENDSVDRIIVDVEGYLDRRKTELEEMARELAKEAVDSGRTVRVRPLSPPERRIIHVTLSDDDRIKTVSTGTGHRRQVIIVPNPKPGAEGEGRGGAPGAARGERSGTRPRGGRSGRRGGKPTRSHTKHSSASTDSGAAPDLGPRNEGA
ncbi:MAG: RNA-binding cell elongation regulator Jag/EloR [Candidatus Hydrogenedentales bacterium]